MPPKGSGIKKTSSKGRTSTLSLDALQPSTSKTPKPLTQFTKPVFSPISSGSKAKTSTPVTKGKGKAKEPIHNDQLWVDLYEPKTPEELAVHKRKVEDVRKWLTDAFSGGPGGKLRKYLRILALTGPSGIGKTATLRALSREMGFEIVEWKNGVDDDYAGADFESMSSKFSHFLTRASSYSSLSFTPTSSQSSSPPKRLILLEDLPNIFHFGTRQAFHAALESFVHSPSCPLVLIVSDSGARGEARDSAGGWQAGQRDATLDIRTALPKSLLGSPYVTEISFNPIAPTLLRKTLNTLLDRHFASSSSQRPPKEAVEGVIDSSNGDIRSAIMALQFACIVDLPVGGAGTKSKKSREKAVKGVFEAITRREQSLALFHLLGKIFYNKRYGDPQEDDKDPMPKPVRLPSHLRSHERRVSKVDSNVLYADSPVDTGLLLLYIYQNYTQFCDDVDEASQISERISTAHSILDGTETWPYHAMLHPYAFDAITSGTLHSLPSPVSRSGQKMYKPEWFEVLKKTKDAEDVVADVRGILGGRWGKEEIVRELSCVLKAWGGNREEEYDFPASHVKFSTLAFNPSQSLMRAKQLDGDNDTVGSEEELMSTVEVLERRAVRIAQVEREERGWLEDDEIEAS